MFDRLVPPHRYALDATLADIGARMRMVEAASAAALLSVRNYELGDQPRSQILRLVARGTPNLGEGGHV
jgi:hypothetical protein